jgi:hypothetical protein
VQTGADLEAHLAQGYDGTGAADSARGPVERGEEAVAGRIDLVAAETVELLPDRLVMALQQFAQARSPRELALSLEPTMSVKSTVARTRSG